MVQIFSVKTQVRHVCLITEELWSERRVGTACRPPASQVRAAWRSQGSAELRGTSVGGGLGFGRFAELPMRKGKAARGSATRRTPASPQMADLPSAERRISSDHLVEFHGRD